MSGLFAATLRRLFAPGPISRSILPGYDTDGNPVPRSVGKNKMLAAGYGKLRKYKLVGKVLKVSDGPDEVLASGECVKEAVSGQALKDAWEADMKRAFPMGADYNVEYHCTVTDVTDADADADDESDDGVAVAAAAAAAVAATTMF